MFPGTYVPHYLWYFPVPIFPCPMFSNTYVLQYLDSPGTIFPCVPTFPVIYVLNQQLPIFLPNFLPQYRVHWAEGSLVRNPLRWLFSECLWFEVYLVWRVLCRWRFHFPKFTHGIKIQCYSGSSIRKFTIPKAVHCMESPWSISLNCN